MPIEARRCPTCAAAWEVLVCGNRKGHPEEVLARGCVHSVPSERVIVAPRGRPAASNAAGFGHYNRGLGMYVEDRQQYDRELRRRNLVHVDIGDNEDVPLPTTHKEHLRASDEAYDAYLEYNREVAEDPACRRIIDEMGGAT